MLGQYWRPLGLLPARIVGLLSPCRGRRRRRLVLGLLGFAAVTRRAAGLDRQHLLAHPDRVALLDVDAAHRPRMRRGQLERGLVGLQLEQRLVRGHDVALADEHLQHLGLSDALAQIRERDVHGFSSLGDGVGLVRIDAELLGGTR